MSVSALKQCTDHYSITGFDAWKSNFSQQPYCFSEKQTGLFGPRRFVHLIMEFTRPKKYLSFAVVTQIVFWLVALMLVLYVSWTNLKAEDALPRAALIFICHLVTFYACYSLLIPRFYEKGQPWLAVIGAIILIIVLTPIRSSIELHFTPITDALHSRFAARRKVRGAVVFSEVFTIAIASLMRLAVSNEEKKTKVIALENLHLQSELRFLKAQMNPHFLFNTINNIYSLTLLKSNRASEALMKLSGLLRYLLYENAGKVTLEREAEALGAYTELFQLRYEQRLSIEIINEVSKPVEIESQLLIPLLENALKHSAIGIQSNASVYMNIAMPQNNKLVVQLHNTKANPPVQQEAGGIGLANIQKRLQLVYPGKHELIIKDDQNTFSITLCIQTA